MPSVRYLIVNADDFGLTEGVNRGIIKAHQAGIVTSASLMVRAPAAAHAATLARANQRIGLGLHIDLGEWSLRDGEWVANYERVAEGDVAATQAELEAQMAVFVELTGNLPDHLDSHQHVHLSRPELTEAVAAVAGRLRIGVRGMDHQVTYRGLYGQDRTGRSLPEAIGPDAFATAIRGLGPGVTEFGCHPGYVEGLESDYCNERAVEVRSLCDESVRAAVDEAGVRLITWRDARAISS
jgi:predicted glycoside hydrolase/deacetylase ChbG (UPF0249 family)